MQPPSIESPRLQQFLLRVHRDVLPLGVRERLQAIQLRSALPVSARRAALASMLSTTPEQWDRIAAIYDASFPPTRPTPAQADEGGALAGTADAPKDDAATDDKLPVDVGVIDGIAQTEAAASAHEAPSRHPSEPDVISVKTRATAERAWQRVRPKLRDLRWRLQLLLRVLPTWFWPLLALLLIGAVVLLWLRAQQKAAPAFAPKTGGAAVLAPVDSPVLRAPSRPPTIQLPPPQKPRPPDATSTLPESWTLPKLPPLRSENDPVEIKQPLNLRDAPGVPRLYAPQPSLQLIHEEITRAVPDGAGLNDLRVWLLLIALALLVALPFSTLGLAWFRLPAEVRKRLPLQLEAQQLRALERRSAHQDAGEPHDGRPVYLVPAVPIAPLSVLEDAANLLGRLYRAEHGIELDVDATLDATLQSGGRLQPIYAPRRVARELLVFIDVETGPYPLLEPFLRVLDYWERIGVPIVRMRFSRWPGRLSPERELRSLGLRDVARSHETAILLVFSRQLRPPQDHEDAFDWIEEIGAWPLRAWIDADPRTYRQRSQMECYDLERIEKSGLLRFPFSKDGLLAVSRFFAAEGIGVRPPPEAALPSMLDAPVAVAVQQLSVAAALVPDPSFDQVDHFRRLLPGVEAALPTASCVYLLLAYLAERSGQDVDGGHGYLNIPLEKEDELIRELREQQPLRPQEGYKLSPSEALVRQELLIQLGDGSQLKEDSLDWWFWYLRCGLHLAALEPKRMPEIYRKLLDSPVAPEASERIEQELRRRPGAHPDLERWLGISDKLLLLDLLRGARQMWKHSLPRAAIASALALLIGALICFKAPSWLGLTQRVRIPATYVVKAAPLKQLPATSWRPRMIAVPSGVFHMGSLADEPGRSVDEPLHRVPMQRRYLLSATEITETQYDKVVFFALPSLRSSDLPKTGVSWAQAWEYCRRLSELEGLRPCSPPHPIRPQSIATPHRCNGYRLPSEAEWEYAARAGQHDAQRDAQRVDAEAWYLNNANGTLHPVATRAPNAWGFFDMRGNAREWVATRYFPDGIPTQDGIDPAQSSYTLIYSARGGSARSSAEDVGIARRTAEEPEKTSRYLGFRIARDAQPTE